VGLMSKIAVTYKSEYGSTKKYAEWIAEELDGDLIENVKIRAEDLENYDIIVYGGGLYAGGINGISLINKEFDKLKDKSLIVFTVGLIKTNNTEIFKPIIEKNCSKEAIEKIKFFHFLGDLNYKKLKIMHKIMIAALKSVIFKKKKEELTEEDRLFMETYGDDVVYTDKNSISPLIDYVNSLL